MGEWQYNIHLTPFLKHKTVVALPLMELDLSVCFPSGGSVNMCVCVCDFHII